MDTMAMHNMSDGDYLPQTCDRNETGRTIMAHACGHAGQSRRRLEVEGRMVWTRWTFPSWYFGGRVKGIESLRICYKFMEFPRPFP